ncbi:MAG: cold-shock protein [Candidatus Paceibacterota bacterium]
MENGTIIRLMDKGYGFIRREGESKDLFFHSNNLNDDTDFNSLKEGTEVTFEVTKGMKGPEAINISVA